MTKIRVFAKVNSEDRAYASMDKSKMMLTGSGKNRRWRKRGGADGGTLGRDARRGARRGAKFGAVLSGIQGAKDGSRNARAMGLTGNRARVLTLAYAAGSAAGGATSGAALGATYAGAKGVLNRTIKKPYNRGKTKKGMEQGGKRVNSGMSRRDKSIIGGFTVGAGAGALRGSAMRKMKADRLSGIINEGRRSKYRGPKINMKPGGMSARTVNRVASIANSVANKTPRGVKIGAAGLAGAGIAAGGYAVVRQVKKSRAERGR